MGADRPTRAQLILRRWQIVVATALFAFVLSFLIGRYQRETLEQLAKLPDWSIVVAIVAVVALFALLSPRRFFAALGLRHPLTYPHYWFGIALGIATALGLIATTDLFSEDFKLSENARHDLGSIAITFALAPVIAFIGGFLRWLYSDGVGLKERTWFDPEPPSLEEFQAWLRHDNPVLAPNRDLFGHSTIAKRMGRRLLKEKWVRLFHRAARGK